MTGGLQQRARVEADVARSFAGFRHEQEAFNRASHDPVTPEMSLDRLARTQIAVDTGYDVAPQIAPAEDLQADPDIEPGLTPRYGVTLAAFVAVLITVHLVWEHMGRPTLAEIPSAIMETLL